MKLKTPLIQVDSQDKVLIHCACCDGESKEVNKFYKKIDGQFLSFESYLDCCKDKVGEVIDWVDWSDYNKAEKYSYSMGHKIKHIKGLI